MAIVQSKAKRDNNTITLGSGKVHLKEYSDEVPSIEDLFKDETLQGYIKGGAALTYTEETFEEKDDLGHVSKIITTSEEVLFKYGLITWNGKTLQQLVDRCSVSESGNRRITKIGGAGNAQGKYYVLGFHHEDKQDGDVYIIIVGRNTAGAEITFAMDNGSLIEPEFKAMPHDEDGTLVQFIEEIGTGGEE